MPRRSQFLLQGKAELGVRLSALISTSNSDGGFDAFDLVAQGNFRLIIDD